MKTFVKIALFSIAAFMGSEWRTAYDYAIGNDFRFLSYGDVCLLLKTKKQRQVPYEANDKRLLI